MSPEDTELWKKVTDGVIPLTFSPKAAAIRSPALVVNNPYTSYNRYFSPTLDLHGMTMNQAHTETKTFFYKAKLFKLKYVRIITGLSGQIKREFPFWLENISGIRRVEVLNGGGSFKIYLFQVR